MIYAELIAMIVIAFLWLAGGQKWSWARDTVIPIIMGLFCFLHHPTAVLWKDILLAVLVFGACFSIRIGYGNFSPEDDNKPSQLAKLTKDRNGWIIRAVWGAIVGVATFLPQIFIVGGLWVAIKCILFTVSLSLICFTVTRLRFSIVPTDLLIGAVFATRIFYF